MKKLVIISLFFLLIGVPRVMAQFVVEYNIGYGTWKMSDMKDELAGKYHTLHELASGLENLKIMDNFPSYWTNHLKFGVRFRQRHEVGFLIDLTNTAGNLSVADYSASYRYTERVWGLKLGGYYRYFPLYDTANRLQPYLQFAMGDVLSFLKIEEEVIDHYSHEENREKYKATGAALFLEPMVGVKYNITKQFAVNAAIGYEADLFMQYYVDGKKADYPKTNWSGFRAQAGISYYFH